MTFLRTLRTLGVGLVTIGLCSPSFAGSNPWDARGLPVGLTAAPAPPPNLLGTPTPVAAPVCPYQSANLQSGAQDNFSLLTQMLMGLWKKRDLDGAKYDDQWTEPEQKELAQTVHAEFGSGCQNFFDKDGKVKPWGQTAIDEIRKRSRTFIENTPNDVTEYCKAYNSFGPGQKERFWAWNLMSMGSAESSCDPKASAWAVNGYAKGIFQMDEGVCNNYELHNPHGNVTCAVRRLAKELDNRGTLMSTCSARCRDPRNATHWGVLRVDDDNKARGGDIRGAQKMRALLKKFKDCKN